MAARQGPCEPFIRKATSTTGDREIGGGAPVVAGEPRLRAFVSLFASVIVVPVGIALRSGRCRRARPGGGNRGGIGTLHERWPIRPATWPPGAARLSALPARITLSSGSQVSKSYNEGNGG